MTDKLLPGSLKSAADLLAKLQRDAALLDNEVTSDRFFNFVVTGYSLIDWIKHDPAVPSSAKSESEIKSLYGGQWLTICGDLAIAAKHFKLMSRRPTALETTAAQGYGHGRYGKGPFGQGEEHITVVMPDGTEHTLHDLVNEVIGTWRTFFARHGLPHT